MTNTWERQLNESTKAYERFCLYRDMGAHRSLRKLAEDLGLNLTTLADNSKKHSWQIRASEFDDFIEQATRQNQLAQVRAMKRRQIVLALKAQKVALLGLKKLLREIESSEARVKPEGLAKLLDSGCRLERLNRDQPEQSVEIKAAQNFERLSEEELETMRRLIVKAEGKI
jgi:hypothetical protein